MQIAYTPNRRAALKTALRDDVRLTRRRQAACGGMIQTHAQFLKCSTVGFSSRAADGVLR